VNQAAPVSIDLRRHPIDHPVPERIEEPE